MYTEDSLYLKLGETDFGIATNLCIADFKLQLAIFVGSIL